MFELTDVCAVIVFYNGDASVIEKIQYLSSFLGRVYIVDNNSNNGILNDYKPNKENIFFIKNFRNEGISYALNQGLKFTLDSGFKLLLTLDQDSFLKKESIERMVQSINPKSGIVSVGPFYGKEKNSLTQNVSYLITSGNLLYCETINRIGGYNEKLFIDCVDIDLSFNLLSNGYKMQKIANTFMDHKIGEYERSYIFRIKYLGHSPNRYYFIFRNNIYIYKTYTKKLRKKCFKLFLSLLLGLLKIVFIERNKIKKIKYSFKGIKDGINNRF